MTLFRFGFVAVIGIVGFGIGGCGHSSDEFGRDVSVAMQGAETVYFAGGASWDRVWSPADSKAEEIVRVPLSELAGILLSGGFEGVGRSSVDHVLIGARNFRPPGPNGEVGPVLADTVYLIRLKDGAAFHPARVQLCTTCDGIGAPVWQWDSAFIRAKPRRVFGSVVGGALLMATSRELLRETMLHARGPIDISEAKALLSNFGPGDQLWCARIYRRTGAPDRVAAGLDAGGFSVGPHAKWMLLEEAERGRCTMRYFAADGDSGPLRIFERGGAGVSLVRSGVWSVGLRLGNSGGDVGASAEIMGLLGFGVYL